MHIDNKHVVTFEVEPETRTIRGLALPFGDVAESNGRKWTFSTDSHLKWTKPKVLDGHDWTRAVGTVELEKTDDGLFMVARIVKGARGDEILALADPTQPGGAVYDGLSIGLADDVKATMKNGVHHVSSATIREVSLTPAPAFDRAQITSVAASATPTEKESLMDQNEMKVGDSFDLDAKFDALNKKLDSFMTIPPREKVAAFDGVQREAAPYRFDGGKGEYEFSTDLFEGMRGSGESLTRVNKFIGETFAVATTNVDELNPAKTRSELYVDYIEKNAPVYAAIHTGGLTDATPFIVPKFSSASNLVADHVEGTEPASDATFVTTGLTVTPAALSGKAVINREVVDAGGNPVVSALIWKRMNQAYAEALETKAAALLNGASVSELGNAPAAGDTDPSPEVLAALAGAVFIDGAGLWNFALMHRELYTNLVALTDTTGRAKFPILAPQNANGVVASKFKTINLGGYEFVPAGSLGAVGTNQKSYIGSTDAVGFWNTAPQRIELAQTTATVSFGLFGYWGGALLDANKIRKITFDSTI